ncbi:MAG TPA: GtrA family protein [Cytophaga sp.]|jgi:putative flippase GtrA|nr:GtrA family protein [Cytophaga sp.]
MLTLLRLQVTSILATLVDFLITVIFAEVIGLYYIAATISGSVSGGVVNFLLNRKWVFNISGSNRLMNQIMRYVLIWIGSILLNASGVFLVTEYVHVNYILSKILVSLIVGISFNQYLQKQFVFK